MLQLRLLTGLFLKDCVLLNGQARSFLKSPGRSSNSHFPNANEKNPRNMDLDKHMHIYLTCSDFESKITGIV